MPRHILVVDNDPDIRAMLSEMFAQEGYAVSTAADGAEGLEKARALKPDCITMEMDLPSISGTIMYARLRRDPAIRNTPVVVVSGVGPRPARLTRHTTTICKPVCTEALLDTVCKALA